MILIGILSLICLVIGSILLIVTVFNYFPSPALGMDKSTGISLGVAASLIACSICLMVVAIHYSSPY